MKKFAVVCAATIVIAGAQFAPSTAHASTVEPTNVAVFPAAGEYMFEGEVWKLDADPSIQIMNVTVAELTAARADAVPASMHMDEAGSRLVNAPLVAGHTYKLTVTFRAKGGAPVTVSQINTVDALGSGPIEVGTEAETIGTRPIVIDDTTLAADEEEIGFKDMGLDIDPSVLHD